MTPAQVALNWVMNKPGVDTVIIGARDEAQLRDNLAAATWRLSRRGDARARRGERAAGALPDVAPAQVRGRAESAAAEYAGYDPAWLTVNVWLPMAIELVWAVPVALASTLNVTVPGPDPAAPPVTVIHVAPLTAVHAQLAPAFTPTDPYSDDHACRWRRKGDRAAAVLIDGDRIGGDRCLSCCAPSRHWPGYRAARCHCRNRSPASRRRSMAHDWPRPMCSLPR